MKAKKRKPRKVHHVLCPKPYGASSCNCKAIRRLWAQEKKP